MHFLKAIVLTALAAATEAQMTSVQVTANIKVVTDLSADTNKIAQSISINNIFLQGPKLVSNFKGIVTAVSEDIAAMQSGPQAVFTAAEQGDVCTAFRDFVKVHQDLLATVIDKKSIFASTPFTAPIAAALRLIEGGVDRFAFLLIGSIPTCAEGAKSDAAKLDVSLEAAIAAYSPTAPGPVRPASGAGGLIGGLTGGLGLGGGLGL